MGFFDQAKMAADLMKNMDISKMKELMGQAGEMQKMLEEQIKKIVDEEIKKRELISKKEIEELLKNKLN